MKNEVKNRNYFDGIKNNDQENGSSALHGKYEVHVDAIFEIAH